jgi:aminoglycoside phosphotransferase (APT) family kinase protein
MPGGLTSREVVPYLREHDLISAQSIVDGDLVIVDASRRNRNFKVIREKGTSYLIKEGLGLRGDATVAHEAAVYQFLQSSPAGDGLERYLPTFYGYDPQADILVIELVRNAQNLREYHSQGSRFSQVLAAAIGDALGSLHRVPGVGAIEDRDGDGFTDKPPWILSVHRPYHGIFHDTSSAQIHLIKIIQQYPEFCAYLDGLREGWSADTLIHHDLRWDNCIVFGRQGSRRKTRLKIVDWELASLGDPCWDVGSVFNDYLSCWLLSIPIIGQATPDRFFELARYPLEKMQPAMRAFWQAYVRKMNLDSTTSAQWLVRAVEYVGARLVQTAFEQMRTSIQPTGNIVSSLQLSLNIMQRPQEAAVHLLGIPLSP